MVLPFNNNAIKKIFSVCFLNSIYFHFDFFSFILVFNQASFLWNPENAILFKWTKHLKIEKKGWKQTMSCSKGFSVAFPTIRVVIS